MTDAWKMVPLEPTEEMLDAYWKLTGESKEMRARTHAYMRRYYKAMLAAAPEQKIATILCFGEGKVVVAKGTYGTRGAVFITEAKMPGELGASAEREGIPKDRLIPGQIVLSFPTTEQAARVESALMNDPQPSDDITDLKAENKRLREAMELATPKKHILRPIVDDETEILKRLAAGDTIRFSQDGDAAWFTKGDGAFVGNAIISLRSKGYLKRECDDEENYRGMSEYDTISDLGRAALNGGDHE
ncbi:hypothetical protein [Rhizobium alvei]|uniref:Uncharacterized protein n=1 Tax=Rhizobium alvei TaxID=1132659 RepID=A0ABT8YTT5_9HYPH|nr:hypothetical protein [Rhizobium alvei]MDO6966930.1 hypothetical protein [Rhizobium alvei]